MLTKALVGLLMAGAFLASGAMAESPVVGDRAHAALLYVLENNAQFASSHGSDYYARFTDKQEPLVTMVSCSDSRVHLHAVDPTPDNDVFVIRNIGNQFATAQGSVEYGVHHLHTPLLMFVGHSACGAVTAAVSDYSGESPAIKRELDTIDVAKGAEVKREIVANVNHQVAAALQRFEQEVAAGTLAVVGVIYDFRNDYEMGQGQLIVVNINGETDPEILRKSGMLQGAGAAKILDASRLSD